MQYVRSIGGSVSKTWNSINPATLSGAIDVIVVEQEDGMAVHGLKTPYARLRLKQVLLLVLHSMFGSGSSPCYDPTKRR